jgi:hypothetical protein
MPEQTRAFCALRAATAAATGLEPRWFSMRNAHDREGVRPVMPRYAMSFMKGPITRREIQRALRGTLSEARRP